MLTMTFFSPKILYSLYLFAVILYVCVVCDVREVIMFWGVPINTNTVSPSHSTFFAVSNVGSTLLHRGGLLGPRLPPSPHTMD